MAVIASDDFNRADYAYSVDVSGVNWTESAAYNTTYSSGVGFGNAAYGVSIYTNATWPDDQYAQAVYKGMTGDRGGIMVRGSAATRVGYVFVVDNVLGGISIYRIDSGPSRVNIANDAGVTVNANDVLYLEAVGPSLTAKINGVTKLTVTDGNITSGAPGVYSDYVTVAANNLDDWEGGDAGGGGGPAGPSIGAVYRLIQR